MAFGSTLPQVDHATPIGGDSRASEELSAFMESLLNDPDIESPVSFVRDRLRRARAPATA